MANRQFKANNADKYLAFYGTKEAAEANSNAKLAIQVFEHQLNGLSGLEGLDAKYPNLQDGTVRQVWVRVCKRQDRKAASSADVPDWDEPVTTSASAEGCPF